MTNDEKIQVLKALNKQLTLIEKRGYTTGKAKQWSVFFLSVFAFWMMFLAIPELKGQIVISMIAALLPSVVVFLMYKPKSDWEIVDELIIKYGEPKNKEAFDAMKKNVENRIEDGWFPTEDLLYWTSTEMKSIKPISKPKFINQ
jgi:hypothetical protein